MSKTYVADLTESQSITSFFLVRQVQVRQKKSGGSYLTLILADRTGEVPAVMWEEVDAFARELQDGDIVKAQGVLGSYHEEPQVTLTRLRKALPEEIDLAEYLPRSEQDPAALLARLREVIEGTQDPFLRRLLADLFADPAFADAFGMAPAAKHIHHAVLGGLLEHTASVVGLCRLLAEYYPALNRDLLLAAAILHDVGKVRELSWDRVFDYKDAGRLVGHITLGVLLVEERIRAIPDFPPALAQTLIHCILSHHGELAWGSPKRPKTLEAMALHYAEDLDGKVNAFLAFAQRYPDPQHPGWTQFNKTLDRYLYVGRTDEPAPPSDNQ